MTNTVIIKPNGPLIARGQVRVVSSSGEIIVEDNEVYLCRCGASKNKPFCDGSHKKTGFTDPARFNDEKSEPLENESGTLEITTRDNAMLIAKGPMQIQSEDGQSRTTRNKAALCRCGASKNKPFCDASHKSI